MQLYFWRNSCQIQLRSALQTEVTCHAHYDSCYREGVCTICGEQPQMWTHHRLAICRHALNERQLQEGQRNEFPVPPFLVYGILLLSKHGVFKGLPHQQCNLLTAQSQWSKQVCDVNNSSSIDFAETSHPHPCIKSHTLAQLSQ